MKERVTGCLSCGTTENLGKRKYCSIKCRQALRYKLDVRTGLLKALNVRYATFYFTDFFIVLDVLPYGEKEIFSFIYPRSNKKTPADDFNRMADVLGNAWWSEKKKTNRNYLASRRLFEWASKDSGLPINPLEIKIPRIKDKSLIHLRLKKSVLDSPDLRDIIKTAYRKQAKQHHPDVGGDSKEFRKIHAAYKELIKWCEAPTFTRRRGFPDKWFYADRRGKWVQPTPY